jgi:hypothetical protein
MNEISKSKSLRAYGAILSLTHILTIYQWYFDKDFALNILERFYPACWPFFESCYKLRPLNSMFLDIYFYTYLAVSLSSLFTFSFIHKFSQKGIILLTVALFMKSLVSISDYRFMGNFHYMCYFVHFAFIFFPYRKQLLPLLLVSFYVGASLVKFNSQWISGEALLKPTFLSGTFLKVACVYVIFLELLLSPLIIWGSKKIRYLVFIQLVIFHLFSWHIVGYLYPLMMLLLLSIFPLLWINREFQDSNFNFVKIIKVKPLVTFLAFFWLAQTGPLWFKGDSAQTGEGRIFSLNMLDAKVKCEEFTYLKYKNKTVEVSDFNFDEGYRIGCDPLLRLSLAKHHCRERVKDPDFINLDFEFFSSKKEGETFKKIIDIKDFCSTQVNYTLFKKNTWILEQDTSTKNIVTSVRSSPHQNVSEKIPLSFLGTQSGWVYGISKDQKPLWSFYANESFIGVTQKPLEDESFIYFLSGNGRLYSLYKKTGTLHWSAFYDKKLSLNFYLEGEEIHLKTQKEEIQVSKKTGEIVSISEQKLPQPASPLSTE